MFKNLLLIALAGTLLGSFAFWLYQCQTTQKQPDILDTAVTNEKPIDPKPEPKKIPIFFYHYVAYLEEEEDPRRKLNTHPWLLDQHIQTLLTEGYTFVHMRDLPKLLYEKQGKYAVLTFDDGYRSLFTNVYPIAQKHNIPFTGYLLAGLINQENYVQSWQVQAMVDSGLFEVGAHGYSHRDLTAIQIKEAQMQIEESKEMLERWFGQPVTTYAYPYGRSNEKVREIVKSAGYSTAVTIEPGTIHYPDKLFEINRVRPGGATGKYLIEVIESQIDGQRKDPGERSPPSEEML